MSTNPQEGVSEPKTEQSSKDTSLDKPKEKNKGGRPKEEHIRLSREARKLLDTKAAEDAPRLYEALLAAALAGCAQSMSMLIQRVWPTRKGTTLSLENATPPTIARPEDVGPALEWVWGLVLAGQVTTDEGQALGALIQQRASAFEVVELAKELEELRARLDSIPSSKPVKLAA